MGQWAVGIERVKLAICIGGGAKVSEIKRYKYGERTMCNDMPTHLYTSCQDNQRQGDTLYFSFSRLSISIPVAHVRAIQREPHIITGIIAIHTAAVSFRLTDASRITMPERIPFRMGI